MMAVADIDADVPATSAVRRPLVAVPDELEGAISTTHRSVSLVGVFAVLWPLFNAWDTIVSVPQTGAAVIALVAGAITLACLVARAEDPAALARLDRWVLALGLLTIAARAASVLAATSGYATDEAALTQGAVNLLLHGHNPYGSNLTGSLYTYAVPGKFWTYLMNGGYVTTFGYPALSLLLITPFVWLTGNGQAVPIASVCALMALTVIVYRLLPRHLRGLAVITCVGIPTLAGFATSGLNIVLMLPFLVLALRRDHTSINFSAWRAGALGLALSVNQLAWFLGPFVLVPELIAVHHEAGRRAAGRYLMRYAAIAGGAFALVNLPFIIAAPGAWVSGAAAPLTQHALPYGQGLVGLTSALGIGGGAVGAYGLAGAALYIALFVLLVWRVDELEPAALLLPLLALFVSGRSLAEYWMAITPAAAVALATRRVPSPHRPWPRFAGVILGGLLVPAGAAVAVALTTPAPLVVRVLSAHSDPRTDAVTTLRIMVANRTREWRRPFFSTDTRGQASAFWSIVEGPRRVPPLSRAVLVLRAGDASMGPVNGSQFVIQAVTDSPRTISLSNRFVQPGAVPAPPS